MSNSPLVQLDEFGLDDLELDEDLPVLFVWSRSVKVPTSLVQLQVQAPKQWEFGRVGQCHVVFDSIECSQY